MASTDPFLSAKLFYYVSRKPNKQTSKPWIVHSQKLCFTMSNSDVNGLTQRPARVLDLGLTWFNQKNIFPRWWITNGGTPPKNYYQTSKSSSKFYPVLLLRSTCPKFLKEDAVWDAWGDSDVTASFSIVSICFYHIATGQNKHNKPCPCPAEWLDSSGAPILDRGNHSCCSFRWSTQLAPLPWNLTQCQDMSI